METHTDDDNSALDSFAQFDEMWRALLSRNLSLSLNIADRIARARSFSARDFIFFIARFFFEDVGRISICARFVRAITPIVCRFGRKISPSVMSRIIPLIEESLHGATSWIPIIAARNFCASEFAQSQYEELREFAADSMSHRISYNLGDDYITIREFARNICAPSRDRQCLLASPAQFCAICEKWTKIATDANVLCSSCVQEGIDAQRESPIEKMRAILCVRAVSDPHFAELFDNPLAREISRICRHAAGMLTIEQEAEVRATFSNMQMICAISREIARITVRTVIDSRTFIGFDPQMPQLSIFHGPLDKREADCFAHLAYVRARLGVAREFAQFTRIIQVARELFLCIELRDVEEPRIMLSVGHAVGFAIRDIEKARVLALNCLWRHIMAIPGRGCTAGLIIFRATPESATHFVFTGDYFATAHARSAARPINRAIVANIIDRDTEWFAQQIAHWEPELDAIRDFERMARQIELTGPNFATITHSDEYFAQCTKRAQSVRASFLLKSRESHI